MKNKLPVNCPSCQNQLKVRALICESCGTEVNGSFELPQLSRLDAGDQEFILDFVRSSGSLKVMAQKLKLSYPTVRNMLDDIINKLDTNNSKES